MCLLYKFYITAPHPGQRRKSATEWAVCLLNINIGPQGLIGGHLLPYFPVP